MLRDRPAATLSLGIISKGYREIFRATVIGDWASSFAVRGSMSTTNGFAVCSESISDTLAEF